MAETIAACFCSDAVHYFPTVANWSGASTIGANFSKRVNALGHLWTVDKVLADADRQAAVLEWTQFDKTGRILRGVDWFVFEAGSFRIQEIGAYGAAPIQPDLERQELRDFDYAGRGYPTTRPNRVVDPRARSLIGSRYVGAAQLAASKGILDSAFRKFSDDILFTKNRIHASFHKSPEPDDGPREPVGREQETGERNFLLESAVTH